MSGIKIVGNLIVGNPNRWRKNMNRHISVVDMSHSAVRRSSVGSDIDDIVSDLIKYGDGHVGVSRLRVTGLLQRSDELFAKAGKDTERVRQIEQTVAQRAEKMILGCDLLVIDKGYGRNRKSRTWEILLDTIVRFAGARGVVVLVPVHKDNHSASIELPVSTRRRPHSFLLGD